MSLEFITLYLHWAQGYGCMNKLLWDKTGCALKKYQLPCGTCLLACFTLEKNMREFGVTCLSKFMVGLDLKGPFQSKWFYESMHEKHLTGEFLGAVTMRQLPCYICPYWFWCFDNFAMTPKIWEWEDLYAVLTTMNYGGVFLHLQLIHQRTEYSLRVEYFLANTQDVKDWHFKLWLMRLKMTWKCCLLHSLSKDMINNTFIILYRSLPNF